MATYHLHRWAVTVKDIWLAPEAQAIYLHGWRDQEGRAVNTSHVVSVNGREITTFTGSIYILEDIDPEYLKFLDKMGLQYDPENPIKTKEK